MARGTGRKRGDSKQHYFQLLRKTDVHIYKERYLVENLFLKLKTIAALLPDTKRTLLISMLLFSSPSSFGYFEGFKTDSRNDFYSAPDSIEVFDHL
ncbi:hypothetical protein D1841_07505 [Neglecta sp. X4]|nr:hypothetical protein [Neglectibacter sp. 59]NBJ73155.1 hypothetical protein [Neglectibacter sp. X4]NCE80982.1 hypothetical protein [Neglectibacter sp. X58]